MAWDQRAVLIVFRGTQSGSLGDIVDDAVVPLVPWPHGSVHLGFKNALDRVWPRLVERLTPLASSRTVWFAGHSLGAALATLAADRFPATAGVCTLGSPRVGDRLFSAGFDARFGSRALRYVNDGDIVTHVPTPLPLPYAHGGALRQITPDGRITRQAPSLEHFVRDIFGNINHLREVSAGLRTGALRIAPKFCWTHATRLYGRHVEHFDARRG